MQQRGAGRGGANQVVRQQRRPEFAANHRGRFATDVRQVQVRLDAAQIKFRVPAEPVQFGDVPRGILLRVGQRRDDVDRPRATAGFHDAEAEFAEQQRLGEARVGLGVHPLWSLRTGPLDQVIIFAQPPAAAEITVPQVMLASAGVRALRQ